MRARYPVVTRRGAVALAAALAAGSLTAAAPADAAEKAIWGPAKLPSIATTDAIIHAPPAIATLMVCRRDRTPQSASATVASVLMAR